MSLASKLTQIFDQFWISRSRDVVMGCVGRIESHDTNTMRADVQLLLEYTPHGETRPVRFAIIPDVTVLFIFAGGYYIRPKYSRGDLVWISYASFSIQEGLSNGFDRADGSIFNRESASVVCGLAREKWSPPAEFSADGLVVGHEGGNMYFELNESEVYAKAATFTIDGDLAVTGEVSAQTATPGAEVNLSTHIHPTGVGPSEKPVPGT